jgi:hypothetical protein
MCGIVFVKRYDGKRADKMVLKRYHAQKSRGQEGFGFVSLSGGKVMEYKRSTGEAEIVKLVGKQNVSEIIFHHRFPTSTPNFEMAAHPIRVSHEDLHYDYFVIHNGVIFNDDKLKTKHESLGFKYNTELLKKWRSNGNTIFEHRQWNDSEALAIELALDLDKNGTGVDIAGSIAFVCLQVEKGSRQAVKVFFGRNYGSPLKIDNLAKHFLAVTSEGNGKNVEVNKLYAIDYGTGEMTTKDYAVGDFEHNYADWRSEERRGTNNSLMGCGFRFNDHDDLPEIDFDIEDMDENDYVEACNEYNEIQKRLAHPEIDEMEAIALEDRRLELEDLIKRYEVQEFGQAIKS